ncbi:MAG: GNAT family N-acetyltransferase [Clostridium sp.]
MKIQINNDEKLKNKVELELHEYNKEHCKFIKEHSTGSHTEYKRYNFIAYDANNLMIGGGLGTVQYEWYYLEKLWIDENHRKQGIGSKIIKEIEKMAIRENLVGIRMETWSFQAKGFYEKNGYEVYAVLPNSPRGITTYVLKKELNKL